MRFTDSMIEKINNNLLEKKKANPISNVHTGIGVGLGYGLHGCSAICNSNVICTVENLDRTITELQMLKEAIEEESGIILED